MFYEDGQFWYVWKPYDIPTTYGTQPCFLEKLTTYTHTIATQICRSTQREFWLVNRLDNGTCGLLYFAKTAEIYKQYKLLQKQWYVDKIYYATVHWHMKALFGTIPYPIAHMRDNDQKMVCWYPIEQNTKQKSILTPYHKTYAIRGKLHFVQTEYCQCEYNPLAHTTLLMLKIKKWIRHQIRCHLASIWHPILNDDIYMPPSIRKQRTSLNSQDTTWSLSLMCAGLSIDIWDA